MAKVVNVHRIDDETFYLVRLTPQEIKPLLPDGLDSESLPEGQVFIAGGDLEIWSEARGRALELLTRDDASAQAIRSGQVKPISREAILVEYGPKEPTVVLTPDEDGGFVAECPAIPGCISQGDTHEEALANITEAISVSLEPFDAKEKP